MRVLVTGGAGFIGSRLVRRLLSSGQECLVVDNLACGGPAPEPDPKLIFTKRDICDRNSIASSIQEFRPSVVVHLAAVHHIPTCERNPPAALNTNVVGFQTILDAATLAGCRKVILASSGAVYEWQQDSLSEDRTPTKATDIYSLSKLTNETQLELWAHKSESSGVVARIFNTIGENDPNGHLIPDILRQLDSKTNTARITLGNLSTRRDYIYVEDTAACLFALIDAEVSGATQYFNVGTGMEYSVRELVEMMANISGRRIEIGVDPHRVRQIDRPSQLADMTKTFSRLAWQPAYSLDEALKSILSCSTRFRTLRDTADQVSTSSRFPLSEN